MGGSCSSPISPSSTSSARSASTSAVASKHAPTSSSSQRTPPSSVQSSSAAAHPLACLGYRKSSVTSSLARDTAAACDGPRSILREGTGSTADSAAPPETPTDLLAPPPATLSPSPSHHRSGPLASIRNKLRARSSASSLRSSPSSTDVKVPTAPATVVISHPRPLRPRQRTAQPGGSPAPLPILPLPPLRTLRHSTVSAHGVTGVTGVGEFGEALARSASARRPASISEAGGSADDAHSPARYSSYSQAHSVFSGIGLSGGGSGSIGLSSTGARARLVKKRRDRLDEDWMWVGVSPSTSPDVALRCLARGC